MARRKGIWTARATAMRSTPTPTPSASGSAGATPHNRLPTHLVAPNAPASPRPRPTSTEPPIGPSTDFATGSLLELQEQLEETEDQIAASRRIYNANVNDYNTRAESFPANLVARRFAFERAVFFTAEVGAERTPVASLS